VVYVALTIKNINIIGESELNDRIRVLNNTECAYPEKTVVELFKESVENNPDKTALEFEHQYVTYRELEERSNQLANFIINRGIKNNDRVAIMAVHSIELVVAILAVMKSGAAYVPLDPEYPSERIKFILRDSDSSLLLTNFDTEDGIQIGIELVNMNQLDWERYSDQAPESSNHWRDLAYIMYTSGSTGKPKGVMVEHRGLTNYAVWARKMYLKDEEESIPLYSSIGFDLTVTSIFVPLISGNKIVIYGKDEDDFELFRIIRENKVTVIKLTPAHLSLLKDLDIIKSSVKRLIVGGENLKVSLARSTADKFGQNIEIYNEYGPTEAVVGCMIHKFDQNRDTSTSVPIGLPADNVQIYILDDNLNIVPQGVIGNLYVSGHGISRGYLNREVLTEEKFIENLFIRGERMYRTGDTARYMKGGTLEYIGREDNQVKIRGHRVEMEEIENCLLDNSAVKRAVVYVKVDTNGNKTVNASIIENETISDVELKQWLSKFLPQYMLPNHYFFMDDFPLTINGKIDYDRLPSMKVKDKDKEFQAPKNEMEVKFLAIMQEVLETDNISMNDNFYELGGDSIKALQISAKLANVGLNLKAKNLLTDDTLFSMAKHITETKKIVNQEVASGTMPTTPIIKWFLRNQFVQENEYNQYVTLEFHRSLNIKDVTIAVNELIRHHDSLRINYNRANDKLFYNEAHQRDDIKVPCIQMGEKKDDLDNAIIEKASVNFNIESSILFQVTMFEYSEDQTIVLFTAHHLIVDGVSWRIIVEDFINILNQLKNNEEVKLPLKTTSLKAWSESLQAYGNYNFGSEKFFWKNILNKQFEYPVDYNNEMDTVENSFTINRILSESMTQNLKSIVRTSYNMQIDEALITSLIITLNKMTGKNEITIEIEKSGRKEFDDNIDISRTIGWFTTIFPAYFECYTERGEYDIRNLKEQLRKIPNGGFHYGMFSFEHSSNNFVRFNYLGDFDNIIKDSGIDLLTIGLNNHPKNLLTSIMDIGCMIRNRKLELFITYSRNKFRDESMESFINCYLDVLETYFAHGNTDRAVNGFTPSDFDAVDISQEDLNVLFL
jgi:amino acid adenylation domain-containing protein/non-ribosomal peptide synthase protein (TIGR01720 family)